MIKLEKKGAAQEVREENVSRLQNLMITPNFECSLRCPEVDQTRVLFDTFA